MIALALVNALLVLLGGVNGKDAWGVSRSELTEKEGDLAIRLACPSKAIFLSARFLYDYGARGFWLSEEDMNEMIGNRDWNGKTSFLCIWKKIQRSKIWTMGSKR